MINPGLLVAFAAAIVLVMIALPIGVAISMRRDTKKEMQALETRMSGRIDELNRLVSALVRAVQIETTEAKRAVTNTELALADIARNERFGKQELDYQSKRIAGKMKGD